MTRPSAFIHPVIGLFSKVRAELEAGAGELGAKRIAAFEAERTNGNINDIVEAAIGPATNGAYTRRAVSDTFLIASSM